MRMIFRRLPGGRGLELVVVAAQHFINCLGLACATARKIPSSAGSCQTLHYLAGFYRVVPPKHDYRLPKQAAPAPVMMTAWEHDGNSWSLGREDIPCQDSRLPCQVSAGNCAKESCLDGHLDLLLQILQGFLLMDV